MHKVLPFLPSIRTLYRATFRGQVPITVFVIQMFNFLQDPGICLELHLISVINWTEWLQNWSAVTVTSYSVSNSLKNMMGNYIHEILDFKNSPCSECCLFSFGWFPGVCFIYADVSKHSICSIFKGRCEDGTERVFRNVGIYKSDAGESPKRKQTYIHESLTLISNVNHRWWAAWR